MNEIVITSTRTQTRMARVPSRTGVLLQGNLQEYNGSTLGTLLNAVPGVVVRDYGSGGGVQTLSMRGMSAEHSLLLLEGIPINNMQTGLTDIRLIPVDLIESVEIVRGGLSSLYGSSAIGGVLNIRTNDRLMKNSVQAKGSAGSFGTNGTSLSVHQLIDNMQMRTGIHIERGSGNYPVQLLQQGTLQNGTRSNSDYNQKSGFLKIRWGEDELPRGHFLFSATSLERGTPGPLLTLENQGGGRQSDDAVLAGASFDAHPSEKVRTVFSASVQRSNQRYADETGIFRGNNYYRNTMITGSHSVQFRDSEQISILTGIDFDHAAANGNALPEAKTRSHAGWYLGGEIQADSLFPPGIVVSLYPSLRLDSYSAMRPSWSPRIGLNVNSVFGVLEVILHSSLGSSFRVPTFNELYYSGAGGYGNTRLNREQSVHYDGGITLTSGVCGAAEFDATYYSITTTDRIMWLPSSSPFIWSPMNIASTQSSGFELEATWSHSSNIIALHGNYSFIDAKNTSSSSETGYAYNKQLIYVPLETANLSMQFRFPLHHNIVHRLLLRIADQYMGERFTVEDNSEKLPSYHVLNGNIGVDVTIFDIQTTIKYEINNIAGEPYEIIPRYPMPLRNTMLSISLQKTY